MSQEQVPLPGEFKSSVGLPDTVSLLRTQVLERMLDDFEQAGAVPTTADLLVLERISYIYAHIRSREMSTMPGNHGFSSERTYKEFLTMLFGATDQITKRLSTAQVETEIRNQVMEATIAAVQKAVSEIADPSLRSQVMNNLLAELGAD